MLRVRWRLVVLAVSAQLLLAFTTCGVREDELRCEEAVAHLSECCPTLRTEEFDCEYAPAVGCAQAHHPRISVETARCIEELDCAIVQKNDLCNRAQQAAAQDTRVSCP